MPMYNLGTLYLHGRGVTQDYVWARQWYEKAAAVGDADAHVQPRNLCTSKAKA